MAVNPLLKPEIGPDGLPREAPVIAYTEKIIEEEQLQLKKYIEENYSKIRDVERELANLTMEVKLTAGPKRAALEHLRKKIEVSAERIHVAKLKEEQAKKAWEAASKGVADEEALKQKLCDDLNNLVQESSNTQFTRLEELKRRLEALNPSRASISTPQEGKLTLVPQSATTASETSSAPQPMKQANGTAANLSEQASDKHGLVANSNNVDPSGELEGRGRKEVHFQGKGKGIGAVPKGRSSPAPGWTGAGFDS